MTKPSARQIPTFTTPQLLELTGLTRRQLQQLEEAGAVTPLRKGRSGRGYAGAWSVMQAVGVAYAKAFLDVGCHATWAWAACAWVARQHPGALHVEFAQGRVLLALAPDGQGQLIEPYLKPGATREQQLKAAQLNLLKTYEGVLRRAVELGARMAREEQELGERLASEEVAGKGK